MGGDARVAGLRTASVSEQTCIFLRLTFGRSDGPWHTQLLQLVTLLRPTVIRRKKNYRKHLHKRQRSSETQPPVDLSQLNLGLDRKQQTAFAQSWFAGRNSEEPIGADQERLFKSHIALAYPAPGT